MTDTPIMQLVERLRRIQVNYELARGIHLAIADAMSALQQPDKRDEEIAKRIANLETHIVAFVERERKLSAFVETLAERNDSIGDDARTALGVEG